MLPLPTYNDKIVTSLLSGNAITLKTKQVLLLRIAEEIALPLFFNEYEFKLLTLISDILMAQNPDERICNPAIAIDKRLAEGKTDGWRYDSMPEDKIAFINGLKGIDEFSIASYNKTFIKLALLEQSALLEKIQKGKIIGDSWMNLPASLFFEELLAEVTAIFYSHPLVQQQIGFVGMADANGWMNINLNSKDLIEPDEIILNKIP